jgi:hypothetical protein
VDISGNRDDGRSFLSTCGTLGLFQAYYCITLCYFALLERERAKSLMRESSETDQLGMRVSEKRSVMWRRLSEPILLNTMLDNRYDRA